MVARETSIQAILGSISGTSNQLFVVYRAFHEQSKANAGTPLYLQSSRDGYDGAGNDVGDVDVGDTAMSP